METLLTYCSRRNLRNLAWSLVLAFLLGFLTLSGAAQPLQAQSGPPTLVITAPAQVDLYQPIQLKLNVRNAKNIAGFEVHLLFDTNGAHFDGAHVRTNDVKKLGRDILPLVVDQSPNGAAFGLASCPVPNCISGQGTKHKTGANGNLNLATAILGTQQAGRLVIKVDAVKFVNRAGKALNVQVANSTIIVQVRDPNPTRNAPASPWQLKTTANKPSNQLRLLHGKAVTFADATEVALAWEQTHGNQSPCGNLPDPALDLNGDGCIDVADVQIAATHVQPRTASAAANAAPPTATWVVNTANDSADNNIGDGICSASGLCTLRAAIAEADAYAGPSLITFNIPGSGVQQINLKTNLPTLANASYPITIDGYTQPGASANTDSLASNAVIKVQLYGQGPNSFDAMRISSAGNVVRGLSFYNMRRSFYLYGSGATNNTIAGNFIGTDAAAQFVSPTTSTGTPASGVYIDVGANGNHIGTPALADRNVISGNARMGASLYAEQTDSNVFQNNIIGLSPDGTRKVRNFKHGIDINNAASNNIVGGTGPHERNIISGDGDPNDNDPSGGVEISHDTSTIENKVLGNCFGTTLDCNSANSATALTHYGIRFEDGVNNNEAAYNIIGNANLVGINFDAYYVSANWVHDNRIGISANGTAIPNGQFGVRFKYHASGNKVGPNNIITNNPTGVQVEYNNELENTITQNSIYNNSFMGIDLGPHAGVTYNQNPDVDSGANNGLNYPVITQATTAQVSGTACTNTTLPKPCTVEVFIAQSTASNDGGGQYGQGKTYLGSDTTDSNGKFSVAVSGVAEGMLVTSTATDAQGDTSEFSLNVQVTAATGPTPTPTLAPTPTPTPSGPTVYVNDTFARTISNGWASADTGGAYSLQGPPGDFSVNGTDGLMNAPTTNTNHTAYLNQVSAQDVDARVRVSTNKVATGGAQIAYIVLRRNAGTNSDYLARMRFTPSGSIYILAMTEVNGVQTQLGSEKILSGVTQAANQFYLIRAQAIGTNPTTINMKGWVAGQTEPTNWMYTVTDSTSGLQAAGAVGLKAYLATNATNNPILFSFDGFKVNAP